MEAEFTFLADKGAVSFVKVQAVSSQQFNDQVTKKSQPKPPGKVVIRQNANLWLSYDNELKTGHVEFSQHPGFDDMLNFAAKLSKFLNERQAKHLIIDFRRNGGGDFFVGLALAQSILQVDSLNWLEGIFVAIGMKTYSAAMGNAAEYQQILNARLVGQPTGANPNGFQELGVFTLPQSKKRVIYSKRRYRFQQIPTQGLQPDIPVAESWQDIKSGRDPDLEAISK